MKYGGPAFPCTNDGHPYSVTGMTLRDYLAAKIIQGIYASCPEGMRFGPLDQMPVKAWAEAAYKQADVMLEVKEAKS